MSNGRNVFMEDKIIEILKKASDCYYNSSEYYEMTEDEYRLAEYKMLVKSSGGDALHFHSVNLPISKYHLKIRKFFKSISLVKKLRETRAFVGFSRLEPNASATISDKKAMLRLGDGSWLPAIEVYGEGIFFEFSSEELKFWAEKEEVKKRRHHRVLLPTL